MSQPNSEISRPNKPLPVPSLNVGASRDDVRKSGHIAVDSDEETDDSIVFVVQKKETGESQSCDTSPRMVSPEKGSFGGQALSSSAAEIASPMQRRGTAVSPRMAALSGPMLGSARNSPMVKRKKSGNRESRSEVDEGVGSPATPSPLSGSKARIQQLERTSERDDAASPKTSKAMKLLGVNEDQMSGSSDGIAKLSPKVMRSPRGGAGGGGGGGNNAGGGSSFLKELEAAKTTGSRVSGAEGPRKTFSNVELPGKSPRSPREFEILSQDRDYDPNDTVETLRDKLEVQRARYEKWKKSHMDETKLKLSIMMEENKELRENFTEMTKQAEAWKESYERAKVQSAKNAAIWDEERTKLLKRFTEDQKKIEKLQKVVNKKHHGKPQGLPELGRSGIFGKGKPPRGAPVVVGEEAPKKSLEVGQPKLIQAPQERDSTPLEVQNSSKSKNNRIRKPEDFQLVSVVGQGGFGAVFLVKEQATGLVCAVKRMSKSDIVAKEQVHTVNVEVKVLKEARLEENKWIVQFHYAFQDEAYIYLAMQFCAGGDLRNLIDNVELEESGVRLFAAEMIVSVNSLHERGYVHRDLKPSNFLIDAQGHLKLADFGLSKSGFEGVKKAAGDSAQIIRVFLVDESYKTIMVNNDTTISEVIKQVKMKVRVPKNAPYLIYECNTINGLMRERPLQLDEKPLQVAQNWQKGLLYKFLFKEADALRVQAMARTRVEKSHRDPFFQQQPQQQTRRARLYSVVGSPHYMAAEILEGSGYDAVADWWSLGCIIFEMLTGIPPFTGNSAEEVFSSVMNSKDTLKFPPEGNYSDSAKDIIRKFLCSPKERLGYNGVGEIKQHEFFQGIDWKNLDSIVPDFVPELDDELDTGYFDSATAEGIENMKMDDRGETKVLNPEEDPWAKAEWNWSAIP